jgi:hypothetical protein
VLAGTALADATGVEVVTEVELELELELELLLQPAAASTAAATAAKPILLSLRTVVPPGVGRSCRFISPKRRGSAGFAEHGRGPPAAASGFRQADKQSLHGPLRWHRETWMNSLRKDLAFSIRQLFCKQFKVTIA